MAQITNIEGSKFFEQNQKIYAQNRIGQFSKFLSKNPIYVTYFVVNEARSTTEVGTGTIHEEIGPKSPLRFNKVINVPVYNIPELKPDVTVDDGYDVEMDINDITFIPGTIRPKPSDYMLVQLYGVKPLLFRCTSYRHNTIQSNDFYMADFSLRDIDQEYIQQIESQVVETYNCHFENIGTNAKVLLTTDEEEKLSDLDGIFTTLRDFYVNAFYHRETDSFVQYASADNPFTWFYDVYLAKFLNESELFETPNSSDTLVLSYNDLVPLNFDYQFTRTLWYAVLKGDADYLNPYNYYYRKPIQKRASPFLMYSIPCDGVALQIMDRYIYPQDKIPYAHTPDNECGRGPGRPCFGDNRSDGVYLQEYFPSMLTTSIKKGEKDPELTDYLDNLIYTYLVGGADKVDIDKTKLLNYAFNQDLRTYMYMPLILYIIKKKYASMMAH